MQYTLRPFNTSDIDSLIKHANNKNISQYLCTMPFPYTKEYAETFIAKSMNGNPTYIFCIDINGEACGACGIHVQCGVYCKNAELGYWLREDYWGKGIISNVVQQTIQYAFNTFDIERLFAKTFSVNVGSEKVLLKNGFIHEAKFEKTFFKNNEYYDENVFEIRRK